MNTSVVGISRLTVGVVTVGVLAACGNASSKSPRAQASPTLAAGPSVRVLVGSTASPPSLAEVTAHLLTLDDLPSGWSEDPVRGLSPTDTRLCNAPDPPQVEAERTAIFNADNGDGQIAENLYGLPSTADAAAAYAYKVAHATCTTYTALNLPVTATLRPTPFPREGQESTAWQMTITNTATGETEDKDVVLIHDGSYDLTLIDRVTPGPIVNLLRATIQKALSAAAN